MNPITKQINLNVGQPNNYQLIHAMQGDSDSIEIIATIYDINKLYTIDADAIVLSGSTPSGGIIENKVLSNTKHTVTFALTKNMLAKNGELRLSLLFLDSSNKQILSSFPFTIKVIQAPAGTIQESELTAITDSLLDAAKYAAESKTYYENLTSQKGKPNGIAELNEDGKIPLSQTYCVNEIWNSTEPSTTQRNNDYWLQEY